jgi:hypothetical protein
VDERDEELLARFDRDLSVDRRGRVRVRNPAGPWALLGLAVGGLCTLGIWEAGRGGFVTTAVLQIVLVLGAALAVLLLLLSCFAGRRLRRAAAVCLGTALSALLALVVLGVAAGPLRLDLS